LANCGCGIKMQYFLGSPIFTEHHARYAVANTPITTEMFDQGLRFVAVGAYDTFVHSVKFFMQNAAFLDYNQHFHVRWNCPQHVLRFFQRSLFERHVFPIYRHNVFSVFVLHLRSKSIGAIDGLQLEIAHINLHGNTDTSNSFDVLRAMLLILLDGSENLECSCLASLLRQFATDNIVEIHPSNVFTGLNDCGVYGALVLRNLVADPECTFNVCTDHDDNEAQCFRLELLGAICVSADQRSFDTLLSTCMTLMIVDKPDSVIDLTNL